MRTSTQIVLLLSINIVCIILGGTLILNQVKMLQYDAATINQLGIIRGSIQRITKQALAEKPDIKVAQQIDQLMGIFSSPFFQRDLANAEDNARDPYQLISELQASWPRLKALYEQRNSTPQHTAQLVQLSERVWEIADDLVLSYQIISERKLNRFQWGLVLGLLVIIFIALIVILITIRIIYRVLERDALNDSLTKVHNRSYFQRVLLDQLAIHQRYKTNFSLMLFDIDFFKRINDNFGHPKGDAVLFKFASLLKENMRAADYIFRIGGEEFAVILPNCDIKQAGAIAEKCRQLVCEAEFGLPEPLTVSAGVAESFEGCNQETIYKKADEALYVSKERGRNQINCS